MKTMPLSVLTIALLRPLTAVAGEAVAIEGSSIIGNRELPKVLYIVPWKQAQPGQMVVRPFSSLYEQTLEPVERTVLLRQLKYFKSTRQSSAKTSKPLPQE